MMLLILVYDIVTGCHETGWNGEPDCKTDVTPTEKCSPPTTPCKFKNTYTIQCTRMVIWHSFLSKNKMIDGLSRLTLHSKQ